MVKSFFDRIDMLLTQSSEEYLSRMQTLNDYYVRDPRISKTCDKIKEKISNIEDKVSKFKPNKKKKKKKQN